MVSYDSNLCASICVTKWGMLASCFILRLVSLLLFTILIHSFNLSLSLLILPSYWMKLHTPVQMQQQQQQQHLVAAELQLTTSSLTTMDA